MKQNKIIITIIVFFFFFILFGKVLAVPAADSPTCQISAEVVKLELKGEINYSMGQVIPAHYEVYLKNISDIKNTGHEIVKCDQEYLSYINADTFYFLLNLDEYNKHPISKGDKIIANVHFGGEWYSGYFLSEIRGRWFNIDSRYIIILIGFIVFGLILVFYLIGKKRGKKEINQI